MAPVVGDRFTSTLRLRWSQLTAPTPGRLEYALRLALICALTMWVTVGYGIPEMALSTYMVFFMNKPDRASSVLTSLVLIGLISVVVGLLLLIAGSALDIAALRVAIMAVMSLSLVFLASASKLKSLAAIVALILVYGLDSLGKTPSGELATRALLYLLLLYGVPASFSILVNLLVGPAPRNLAERALAARLRAMQALLAAPDVPSRQRIATLRSQGSASVQGLCHLALLEKTSPHADVLALQQAARSTDVLLMLAEMVDRAGTLPESWRRAAAARLGEMAAIIDSHFYPLDIEAVAVPDGIRLGHEEEKLVADFNAVLVSFAVAPPPADHAAKKAGGGFFASDAWSNPDHARFAIKVSLAAMFCYLFYSMADWPGIHTCLITCYIVALDTTAETVEKLTLRIVGALFGAAAGLAAIVWLLPSIDRIEGLLVLVFAGGLAGGWIAAGSPRIAYAGFQVAFAFFLCVIQGSKPEFDLSIARDRIVGILLGNAIIFVIFVYVWPVSIAHRIDSAISALLHRLSGIARLDQHHERRDALPAAHVAIGTIATDLEVAHYEPASLRPPLDWFAYREALLADLPGQESALWRADDRAALDAMAARFEQKAKTIERGEKTGRFDPVGAHGPDPEQNIAH